MSNVSLQAIVFLTPIEDALWFLVAANASKVDDEFRVSLEDDAALTEQVKQLVSFEAHDALDVLASLIDRKLLVPLGKATGGRTLYRIACDPSGVHTISIDERPTLEVSAAYLKVIRAAQDRWCKADGFAWFPEAFLSWLSERFPGMNAESVKSKLVGYLEGKRQEGWGIVYRRRECDSKHLPEYLPTLVGFERFVFMTESSIDDERIDRLPRHNSESVSKVPFKIVDRLIAAWELVKADAPGQIALLSNERIRRAVEERQKLDLVIEHRLSEREELLARVKQIDERVGDLKKQRSRLA